MSLTKYYRILGLPSGADQAAVRKAFRKLAMRYHPDRNPSTSAQTKFIAITEAYEILTGKKPAPAQRISRSHAAKTRTTKSSTAPGRAVKSQVERVREAKQRQEELDKKEHEENERYFKLLTTGWRWKIMRWSAILGLVLSLGLVAERFLPHHFELDEITHYSLRPGITSGRENISIVQTEQDKSFWISRISYALFGRNKQVYIESSWLFHEPIQLVSIGKINYRTYGIHYSFYSNFGVMIFFFLLPGLTLFMKNRTILFTIIYQSSFYGVNMLMLYFLFRNDHWAHILTLGFF